LEKNFFFTLLEVMLFRPRGRCWNCVAAAVAVAMVTAGEQGGKIISVWLIPTLAVRIWMEFTFVHCHQGKLLLLLLLLQERTLTTYFFFWKSWLAASFAVESLGEMELERKPS